MKEETEMSHIPCPKCKVKLKKSFLLQKTSVWGGGAEPVTTSRKPSCEKEKWHESLFDANYFAGSKRICRAFS